MSTNKPPKSEPEVHVHVSRLWAERQTKYTRATLETLAIIAYRQPITRADVERVAEALRATMTSAQQGRVRERAAEVDEIIGLRRDRGFEAAVTQIDGFATAS